MCQVWKNVRSEIQNLNSSPNETACFYGFWRYKMMLFMLPIASQLCFPRYSESYGTIFIKHFLWSKNDISRTKMVPGFSCEVLNFCMDTMQYKFQPKMPRISVLFVFPFIYLVTSTSLSDKGSHNGPSSSSTLPENVTAQNSFIDGCQKSLTEEQKSFGREMSGLTENIENQIRENKVLMGNRK